MLGAAEVREVSLWATDGLLPDLTVLLDLHEEIGMDSVAESSTQFDRLEAEKHDFHARVRAAYLELAAAERVARQIDVPVIAISEEMSVVTIRQRSGNSSP